MANLRVSTDGTAGPYIMVPSGHSDALMAYLSENGVAGTLGRGTIRSEGKDVEDVVNLGMGAALEAVQALFDRWQGHREVSASDAGNAKEGISSAEAVGSGKVTSSAEVVGSGKVTLQGVEMEAAGTFTPAPSFVLVWDPEIVSESEYADLVTARGTSSEHPAVRVSSGSSRAASACPVRRGCPYERRPIASRS